MSSCARIYLTSLAFALAGTACGDTPAASDSGEVGSGDVTGVEAGTSESEAEESAGYEQVPARGITITSVVANPGTRIPLADGADWVDGNSRNGFLPRDRDTLIRINYGLEEAFTPRLIEARLHLEYGDGSTETLVQVAEVSSPSNETALDRSFFFGLIADDGQTKPGMKFQVELWEVAPGGEAFTEAINVSPASGREIIGFEDTPMEMNIVIVPITYNGSDPGLTDANKNFIVENGLLQQNPLQKVNVEWHDPVPYTQPITDLGSLLPVMSQLRQSEGRGSSNYYYAAVVRTGGGGVAGVAGIAYVTSSQLYQDRVSANVWNNEGSSTDTIVHEVGHNQGLSHVFCAGGGAANTNPTYPDPGGFTQQPGFGIRDFQIRPSSQYDYMSYCGPSWVSEWTWNVAYARIRSLTAHDYDDGNLELPPTRAMLKGIVHADGSTQWWTGDGAFDPELSSGNHVLEFDYEGHTLSQPATVSVLSDDKSLWISAPLPAQDVMQIDAIRYRTQAGAESLERSAITQGHTRL